MKTIFRFFPNLLALLFILLVFGSCRTLNLAELTPENRNEHLLPDLTPEVDVSIIEGRKAWSSTSRTEVISDNSPNSTIIETVTDSRPLTPASTDIITLFERDVNANIINPYGENKGQIVCKIVAYDANYYNSGLRVISTLTFGFFNLFGMPFDCKSASYDIEVNILNNEREKIGQYSAVGKAKVYSALFYGFDDASSIRLSRIRAFKNAMNKVKEQINCDYEQLNMALKD